MKSFKFVLVAACAAAISLNAEILTKTTEISLDGKKVGKIEVLTPVEVVSKDGAKAKIKVKGAVSANYLAQIQRSVKNAEIFTVFDAESEANFKKIKEVEDDYGELWYEVEGTYEVAADALYKQAQQKYEETCSACHRLHEPNSFTAAQWPANLQSMIDTNYVALEETELNLIVKYLQHNAKAVE
ncbi:molybdopterin-containing oxidoreductase III, DMSO/TMAO/BSO reductase family, monoheme c-type cytochrome [Campylobacter showae]|uniref:Cytochrome c-type protein TorY n=1 Tax=Campylobacter showae RM3277 TaxID=553219 RepID=C6RHL6_9BACT|nr:hypothetical protein [Campylobacter showae]EET79233.1 hypothetical protein CAMSH0001_0843 [Campylobacter showae RM3277]QCD49612.1 molybdopterin-containing oxidoreductase III, DMSO/TMAO/BSO reductase family, monoheme c-type cytochrome [Campylobacter showae]